MTDGSLAGGGNHVSDTNRMSDGSRMTDGDRVNDRNHVSDGNRVGDGNHVSDGNHLGDRNRVSDTNHRVTDRTSDGTPRRRSLTRQATIFDLDDTLVDSGDAWGRVCGAFAARHGHSWRAEDDAALHGNGGWATYVAGLCGDVVSAAEVLDSCTSAMAEECAAGRVKALPGAVDLVLEAERHGPIGMATASPRRYVLAALSALALTGRMRTVVCGEDVTRNKPAPDPYLRAAAAVGVAPSDCLAVEDSPRGIRSAAAAGMRVLAVPRGGMTLPAEVAHLPAAHARDAADALPLLTMMLTSRPEPALNGGML